MTKLRGRSGKNYTLDKELAHGGEGIINTVIGDNSIVVKQYRPEIPANRLKILEKKLTVMINDTDFDYYCDGVLRFAWPTDLVYDSNNQFVGFVMPFAKDTYEFHELMWPDKQKQFQHYDYLRSIVVSYNLASAVEYAHSKGYVLGDMNIKNFRFNKTCQVTLLDVDSFDLAAKTSDPTCKCFVGTPDYLAPELQGTGDLSRPSAKFTKESDYFSMALLIFQFLMDGAHPFNAPRVTTGTGYSSSATGVSMQADIASGNCPYVRGGTGKIIPAYAPNYHMLPANLRELFRRTFGYTQSTAIQSIPNRATPAEFRKALHHFYSRTDKTTCATDPRHIYLSRLSNCPFCDRDQRMNTTSTGTKSYPISQSATKVVPQTNTPPVSQSNTTPASQSNTKPKGLLAKKPALFSKKSP